MDLRFFTLPVHLRLLNASVQQLEAENISNLATSYSDRVSPMKTEKINVKHAPVG